ncbi:methyl-accepting chemotaxis protein, partial [Paenibacillus sepulcri]|nr:methyl-accepting chemotaxis protein [Paenibacillus sepulcri]
MGKFRLRVSYKITSGYIILLLFLGVTLFIVSGAIQSLQGELSSIVSRDLKIHELTHTLDKYASSLETDVYRHSVTGKREDMDRYESDREKWRQDYGTLKTLFAGNSDQTSRLVGVSDAMERWFAISDKAAASISFQRSADAAIQYFQDNAGDKAMTGMKEQLSRLRQSEKYVTEKRIGQIIANNDRLQSLLQAMAIALSVLTIVFSWLISRNITGNLKRVTAAIGEIAKSGGDLTRRIRVKATDETRELGDVTNRLLASMQVMMR